MLVSLKIGSFESLEKFSGLFFLDIPKLSTSLWCSSYHKGRIKWPMFIGFFYARR